MTEEEIERLLGRTLEEYHRRRALGEQVSPGEWAERLGEHYAEFREILAAASAIDDLLEAPTRAETFPRTFGEYTLMSVLGRGAMGIVYEAVHRGLGRKVALKVLRSGFEDDPLAYERFRREARACAQIRHDHIVEIYEAGQIEGRPFYAMPILEGRSLLQMIRSGEAPPPEELCRGLADVADALDTLHRAEIIHRDVKPANIMVEPGGRMILADFGLARTAASQTLTATGQALGTPLYMSPEQLLGGRGEVDGRSDVYGLGVTLYEALAGKPPFQAGEVTTLMRMIITERPRPLPDVVPDAPLECSFIAMKAMEKRKEDRYQTAAAIRSDLLALAEGKKVEGRPVSHLRFTMRRYRRHLVAAAAALLVLAVGAALFATRDATLRVVSFPIAQVSVDERSVGTTPLEMSLAPGSHRLRIRQEGFGEREITLRLGAGENRTLETALIALDTENPAALRRMAEELDVALETFAAAERARGEPEGPGVQVLYPRGNVRLADLTEWRIDWVDRDFEIEGEVWFRRGGEVLARLPFPAEQTWTIEEIPAELRDALRAGDEIEWGYHPRDGDPVTAAFRVVEDPLAGRLTEIARRTKDQPGLVRAHLETQLCLDHDLLTAALLTARRITKERSDSDRGWGGMLEAARRMGLEKTLLYRETLDHVLRE